MPPLGPRLPIPFSSSSVSIYHHFLIVAKQFSSVQYCILLCVYEFFVVILLIVIMLQSNHMRKAIPSVITKVKSRQILDSRGIPTVEVDLHTNKGAFSASVPSGASSGMYALYHLMILFSFLYKLHCYIIGHVYRLYVLFATISALQKE